MVVQPESVAVVAEVASSRVVAICLRARTSVFDGRVAGGFKLSGSVVALSLVRDLRMSVFAFAAADLGILTHTRTALC